MYFIMATLLCLKFSLPKSSYNDPPLPFYQTEIRTYPTFYYQPPILGFFDFTENRKNFYEKTEFFLRTKIKNKHQVGTNYYSLQMSKALLSSFRTPVLSTLFFNLVCFLVFLSGALRHCRSPANMFSTLTKNRRRLAELLFFCVNSRFNSTCTIQVSF